VLGIQRLTPVLVTHDLRCDAPDWKAICRTGSAPTRSLAISAFATEPSVLAWCKDYNKHRDSRDRIKRFLFHAPVLPDQSRKCETLSTSSETGAGPKNRSSSVPSPRSARTLLRRRFSASTTGERVNPSPSISSPTHAQELAQYHIHPDSKFLDAEYFDSGKTHRRHVVAGNIHHIGKEAENLEEHLELGSDPDAVIEYGIGIGHQRITLDQLRTDLQNTNLSRLRIASGVSRQPFLAGREHLRRFLWENIAVDCDARFGENTSTAFPLLPSKYRPSKPRANPGRMRRLERSQPQPRSHQVSSLARALADRQR
jgi:hypothetical protein